MKPHWSAILLAAALAGCGSLGLDGGKGVAPGAGLYNCDTANTLGQGQGYEKWATTRHCITVHVDEQAGRPVITLTCMTPAGTAEPCDRLELNKDPRHWILWQLDASSLQAGYTFGDKGIQFSGNDPQPGQFYNRGLPWDRQTFVWHDFNTDSGHYDYKIYLRKSGSDVTGDPSVWNNG
jgi:hypothetical protein